MGLEKTNTVYTAELNAIDMVLGMTEIMAKADNNRTLQRVNIFINNQAAIKIIGKGNMYSGQILLCSAVEKMDRIRSTGNINITLCQIPAHMEIPGNEIAGKTAKEAAEMPTATDNRPFETQI